MFGGKKVKELEQRIEMLEKQVQQLMTALSEKAGIGHTHRPSELNDPDIQKTIESIKDRILMFRTNYSQPAIYTEIPSGNSGTDAVTTAVIAASVSSYMDQSNSDSDRCSSFSDSYSSSDFSSCSSSND